MGLIVIAISGKTLHPIADMPKVEGEQKCKLLKAHTAGFESLRK